MRTVLLTGGLGYIGSHTAVELIQNGYEVVIADNLSNSNYNVLERIKQITGKAPQFYLVDVEEEFKLANVFAEHEIDAVIHFAGYKAVGESVNEPLKYYENNIMSTISLLKTMIRYGVSELIFSSSATVYGAENNVPYTEDMKTGASSSPYGQTKNMIEQIIKDTSHSQYNMSAVILRYFNPIGAHESGLIGENPMGVPNNLMPYITQTAAGLRDKLTIFGSDYETPDGTCRRDYIHVVDLAKGHVKALEYLENHSGVDVFNLGTGIPYSVTEIVSTFENVNGLTLNKEYGKRRPGDIAETYADVTKAKEVLGWQAEKNLADMCRDSWNFQKTILNK